MKPRFGYFPWGRVKWLFLQNRFLCEDNRQWEGIVSCRKCECTICWSNRAGGETVSKKKVSRHRLQRKSHRRKDSQQEGCREFSNICENCARGSKSSDIGEEVKLKTLFFAEYSVQTNRNPLFSEYCWGNRITKAELEVEGFLFSI